MTDNLREFLIYHTHNHQHHHHHYRSRRNHNHSNNSDNKQEKSENILITSSVVALRKRAHGDNWAQHSARRRYCSSENKKPEKEQAQEQTKTRITITKMAGSQIPLNLSSRLHCSASSEQTERPHHLKIVHSSCRRNKESIKNLLGRKDFTRVASVCSLLVLCVALGACAADDSAAGAQPQSKQQIDLRSTQPTLDRQLETPNSPSSISSSASSSAALSGASSPSASLVASSSMKPPTISERSNQQQQPQQQYAKPQKPAVSLASQKKAAALAAQRDYDKYQLKASPSLHGGALASGQVQDKQQQAAAVKPTAAQSSAGQQQQQQQQEEKEKEKANSSSTANNDAGRGEKLPEGSSVQPAHKKLAGGGSGHSRQPASSFSLLKKFLPSFMTSAAAADKHSSASHHSNQHSRSSPSTGNSASMASSLISSLLSSGGGNNNGAGGAHYAQSQAQQQQQQQLSSESARQTATGKIMSFLGGAQKKRGLPEGVTSAIPNHAPFFMRKSATDRQAGGGGALGLASSLLSNPLKLGLLFSAPLLPSLLLTPLAIAGLSPAMSAINNFFGDDDDQPAGASSQSPLAALASGPNSPLASILQATGAASPFASNLLQSDSSASGSSSSGAASASSSSPANSFALQAFQSLLGPTSTTERPLFNPGMFAASSAASAIQNAAGSLVGGSGSSGGASSSSSGQLSRPLFGGGAGGSLMQAAASMIAPSFAAPPSSGSQASGSSSTAANDDDDGPGIVQMASDVFEKMANYMGTTDNKNGQQIGQASGASIGSGSGSGSPLSALASLSSLSPFQLSSLFSSTPFGSALSSSGSSSSSNHAAPSSGSSHTNQRAGFFSTLRNVYELFSSSFLRRQEVGNENECQQRLVCELHQRAMNSKLFRRSLQTNLMELANLDKNLIGQLKISSQEMQARVDPDTKAMLSDFLKATNNFKSGREMINCSQMFPKCTRTQLLAAANAHLADPANGRAIGKFSQLMKKMKFKANQQHQSQWKLRKQNKPLASQTIRGSTTGTLAGASINAPPVDYLQVAPLTATKAGGPTSGQLTPVDSLKLAQQIMMLSQQMGSPQQQQQQQQQQQVTSSPSISQYVPIASQQQQQQQYGYQPNGNQYQSSQPQSSGYSASSYLGQYSPAPIQKQTTYTDAIMPPVYSSTDSPYFIPAISQQQQQQQQQSYIPEQQSNQMQQPSYGQQTSLNQQPQPQQQQPQPQQSVSSQQQQQQQFAANGQTIAPSSPVIDQSIAAQQQRPSQNLNMDNKNKPQQLLTPNQSQLVPAAA